MTSATLENDLVLRFSHNVVEHLGLKLYQNKPTNVIAEVVSNSWDADAPRVKVNTSMGATNRWIAVHDDGRGMTRAELSSSYLIIGGARRAKADERSAGKRRLMGRKGIGKLAPFGIACQMDVVTCANTAQGPRVHWLRFKLSDLLRQSSGEYLPAIIVSDGKLEDLPLDKDPTAGQVEEWRRFVKPKSTGTLIIMTDLSLGRALNDDQLIDSLGRRFTVAVGHGFTVSVNGTAATAENMLPDFDFRIPEKGHSVELVAGREVKCWVGFVKKADWPADQAGVGVYAHGKLAQDRPFTFGVKGKEIFTRYMFGVVEAEWLDELDQDVISTDRTSVNWELPETRPLYEWGQKKVSAWVAKFEEWRATLEEGENRQLVQTVIRTGEAPRVTEPEEEEIVRLVSSITPQLGKDTDQKKRLVKAVSEAWVQTPMRKLVRDLWSSVGKGGGMPPAAFTQVVEKLSAHSVPESLNLAVIFAQRAFALTRLHDYVHHGDEVDLQRLIEKFPWIVEPDLAVLTANQQLKTAINKAGSLGQIPTGRRAKVAGIQEENRPDFVFLSSPMDQQILVVELKNPQEDLTIENRKQLEDYMTWFETHYPDSEITGYLVGRKPNKMTAKYEGMKILPWTEVLSRSRARNLELLAAMLLRTGSGRGDDVRVADAIELGGAEAKQLLERLATEHRELRDLMNSFDVVKSKLSPAEV